MSPQHYPTEFPEPTYKEAVEGWQHCQTVNAQLLKALKRIDRTGMYVGPIKEEARDAIKAAES